MSAPSVALLLHSAVICRHLPSRRPFLLIPDPLLLFICIYPLVTHNLAHSYFLSQFDVQMFGQT